VQLPFDPKHVVYVWFDALLNYLTAAGLGVDEKLFAKAWPASVHIVGKDITRFHCVYWPAMLMSLGLPLPKRVFGHGFLQLKGSRMSKSSGNIITPDEVMAVVGPDALRYSLLAENDFSGDGNFSYESLAFKVNADLSNDFGNLVNGKNLINNESFIFAK
jgi:methionyl-tRNA synthetase